MHSNSGIDNGNRSEQGNFVHRPRGRTLFLTLKLLLAASFVLAGVTKFANPADYSIAMIYSFGFPEGLSIIIGSVLPIVEVLLGVLLLNRTTSFLSLTGIQALLLGFAGFHVWTLALGNNNQCHCYGTLLPLSQSTSFSLVILLIVGSLVLKRSMKAASIEVKTMSLNLGTLTTLRKVIFIGVCVILMITSALSYTSINRKLQSGLVGEIHLPEARSRIERLIHTVLTKDSANSRPRLVIFVSNPNCSACLSEILFWNQRASDNALRIVAVFHKEEKLNKAAFGNLHGLKLAIADADEDIWHQILGKWPPKIARFILGSGGELRHVYAQRRLETHQEFEAFADTLERVKREAMSSIDVQ